MPRVTTSSSARINCRISHSLKEKVEAAARLRGQTVTAFTESALAEKAQEVLQNEERIQLSQSAFEAFLHAIESPPEKPSAKLQAALVEYKQQRS